LKPYRVDFEFTDKGYLHIVAPDEKAASEGAVQMVKNRLKNPVVTNVVEVDAEDDDQLELPFAAPTTQTKQ
jgi:phosphoribosylformylglycinamidine (FGAM) synthase PurS component